MSQRCQNVSGVDSWRLIIYGMGLGWGTIRFTYSGSLDDIEEVI